MKKIILSAFVLSMAIAVQAQQTNAEGHKSHMNQDRRHHGRKGMDLKALNLTEDQKAKFKTENENFRSQMAELKKNESITVGEAKKRSEKIRSEHKANIDKMLTADQKSQLKKMKADAKQNHELRGKDRGERMKAELNLTPDQSAKMKAHREEMGKKMKAIKENSALNDEQKKEQMKELMKSQKETMKSILTEEQLKKMKESHHRDGGNRQGPGKKQTTI